MAVRILMLPNFECGKSKLYPWFFHFFFKKNIAIPPVSSNMFINLIKKDPSLPLSETIYQCPCLQSNHKSIRRNAEQLVAGPMGGIGNSSMASTKARKVALLSPHPVSAFNSSMMLILLHFYQHLQIFTGDMHSITLWWSSSSNFYEHEAPQDRRDNYWWNHSPKFYVLTAGINDKTIQNVKSSLQKIGHVLHIAMDNHHIYIYHTVIYIIIYIYSLWRPVSRQSATPGG